jgi:hypothetical protein
MVIVLGFGFDIEGKNDSKPSCLLFVSVILNLHHTDFCCKMDRVDRVDRPKFKIKKLKKIPVEIKT